MNRYTFILGIFCTLFAISVYAEEPKRGLLPDGRAYRIDQEGNELVDYIAELEVDVDNLKRRVNGCEDQLREREGALERATGGRSGTTIEERDLKVASKSQEAKKPACPVCEDCSVVGSKYEERIRQLNSETVEARRNCEANIRAVSAKSASGDTSCASTINELRAALKQSQKDWERLNADSEKRVATLNQDLKSARLEAANAKDKLKETQGVNSRVANLEEQLKSTSQELTRTREQLASAQNDLEASRTRVASVSSLSTYSEVPSERPLKATTFNPPSQARERVVTDLRLKLLQDLERTQATVRSRDEAFSKYQQRGAIKIYPSKAISSRGETVDSIRKELNSATTVRELLLLRQDIADINRKASEDIALVNRMKMKK